MSKAPCDSVLDKRDAHGGFALCHRDKGHDGMHVGASPDADTHQWDDAAAMPTRSVEPEIDEHWWLPPLDSDVIIVHNDGEKSGGVLRATVMTEPGSIFALLLDGERRRFLVSWADVSSISWERPA